MANTIVERCRCLHAVVNDSVSEQGSDLFLMRSTIASPVSERLGKARGRERLRGTSVSSVSEGEEWSNRQCTTVSSL